MDINFKGLSDIYSQISKNLKEIAHSMNEILEDAWREKSKNVLLLRVFLNYTNLLARDISLADILREKGYRRCGIYGYGNVGQCVYIDLINHGFEVTYVVDRAYQMLDRDSLECIWHSPEDAMEETDVLLVTPVFSFREVYEVMKDKVSCPIVSIDDFVQE